MKSVRTVAALAAASLAIVALVGCGGADSNGGSASSSEGTSTPAPSAVETMKVKPGKKADTGPWTVTVKSTKRGTKFGRHIADEGTLVLVTATLTNNTDRTLPVMLKDFSLTDGENFTGPLEGDNEYSAEGAVQVGKSKTFKVVFYVPPHIEGNPLTFVFQNAASGENVRVESPLK